MAQLCVRLKGDPHCPFHPKQNVILRCKDCPGNILVCLLCITSMHEGHTFGEIQDGIAEKVENIKQFITNTETLTIPQLTAEISSIAKKKKTTTEMFQSEIHTVRVQAEQLRELVDLQMTKTVSGLESEMKDTLTFLDSYQRELEQFKSKLGEEIKDANTTLTSDSNVLVLDVENEIRKKSDDCIPPSPNISVPHFVPCKDPLPYVEMAFGDLKIKKNNSKRKLSDDATTTATLPTASGSSKYKPSRTSYANEDIKSNLAHIPRRILDQPVQCTQLKWRDHTMSLCPIPNNMAWVHSADSQQLDLIEDRGAVQKTLTLNTKVCKICLHPSTGDVYGCCRSDNSVKHINMQSMGKIETTVLFITDSEPWSIACTSDNVIVGMEGKVCMYTYKGKVVYSNDIRYNTAFYISVCSITSRVAVACSYGGVLVLDNTLQELYRYKGEGVAASSAKKKRLENFCAVFDDDGYLLVGDCYNKEVHVLNDKATCISTIKTKDMAEVRRLGTHDGVLWVGCRETNTHRIVIVKYMDGLDVERQQHTEL